MFSPVFLSLLNKILGNHIGRRDTLWLCNHLYPRQLYSIRSVGLGKSFNCAASSALALPAVPRLATAARAIAAEHSP